MYTVYKSLYHSLLVSGETRGVSCYSQAAGPLRGSREASQSWSEATCFTVGGLRPANFDHLRTMIYIYVYIYVYIKMYI